MSEHMIVEYMIVTYEGLSVRGSNSFLYTPSKRASLSDPVCCRYPLSPLSTTVRLIVRGSREDLSVSSLSTG